MSPTEGDLSVTAAEATKRWVTTGNAVIKSQDGSWYTAVKVRKVARAGEFSVFLSGEAGSGHVTEVAEKCILDAKAMGRKACKQIIFGCVGGVFNSADGRRMARVTGCTGTAAGDSIARLHFVHWNVHWNEERTISSGRVG